MLFLILSSVKTKTLTQTRDTVNIVSALGFDHWKLHVILAIFVPKLFSFTSDT